MITNNFFQEFDLPQLPEHLVQQCIETVTNNRTNLLTSDNYFYPNLIRQDGTPIPGSMYARLTLTKDLDQWVKENIKPFNYSGIQAGVQIYWSKESNFDYAAHVDGPRGRVLMYSIDPGGDDVHTTWYQEPNKPLYRTYNVDFHGGVTDLRTVNKIHDEVVKKQTWTILETRIIHGVSNMIRPRITLAVGVSDDEVNDFCKLHGIDPSSSDLWLSRQALNNKLNSI